LERETRGRLAALPETCRLRRRRPTYKVDVDNSPIAKSAAVIAFLFSLCYLFLEKSILAPDPSQRLPGSCLIASLFFVENLPVSRKITLWHGAAVARSGQTAAGPRSSRSVYGWFTEGFDTLDLKQAKALLDELAS
jgi:hypothetical protein